MKSVLPERITPHPHDIEYRELSRTAAHAVRDMAKDIAHAAEDTRHHTARTLTNPGLIEQIARHADELPNEVGSAMRPPATNAGVTVIHGLALPDEQCGPTPPDWQEAAAWSGDSTRHRCSFEIDIAMLLLAANAGEPFGWQGQQDGRLVNNILPAVGHEDEQSGASSTTLLSPHTEDAFHPDRAHLLALICLRNPDRIATTVSSVRHVQLGATQQRLLSTPVLPILPDVSYGADYDTDTAPTVPTIWSNNRTCTGTAGLTLRYDPAYTPLADAEAEFRDAYTDLSNELERVHMQLVLAPGEILLMDNDVVVHGRAPFTPRYDGTDRWLKRVNIRLPERRRHAAETDENGYGQQVVAPFGAAGPAAAPGGMDRDAADDRGSDGHP